MRVSRGRCLLWDWIKYKGWTQSEYARRSGLTQRRVSYLCNGERVMLPEEMYVAERLLGCRWDQLYEILER